MTAEELVRGALGKIRDEEKQKIAGLAHPFLVETIQALSAYSFLPFDDAANAVYLLFPAAVRRIARLGRSRR